MGNSADKLAIDGGRPVREAPLPARGHIGEEEREAVGAYMDKVLATGNLGAYQGEEEEAYWRGVCGSTWGADTRMR